MNCVVCYLNLKDINAKYLKLRTQKQNSQIHSKQPFIACLHYGNLY